MKHLIVLSGGLDSTTLMYLLKKKYAAGVDSFGRGRKNLEALIFKYGQKHTKETRYAAYNCALLGVSYTLADITSINGLIAKGALAGLGEVPEGRYDAPVMIQTVVPNRNMILLSIAAGYAASNGIQAVHYAAHKGDHTIYPDCRPEFVSALRRAIRLGNLWENKNESVMLFADFIHKNKAQIVRIGEKLHVPFSDTWSCYNGRLYHCGKCGTCVERKEAFVEAGVTDPTVYES